LVEYIILHFYRLDAARHERHKLAGIEMMELMRIINGKVVWRRNGIRLCGSGEAAR
jgi:hypothetical protein